MAKYLIIVALCILGASLSKAGESKEEMMKAFMTLAEACKTEAGAAQSDIDDIIAKNPAASREGKCMRACILQKFGVMDADGNIVKDVALEHCKQFLGNDPAMLKKAEEALDNCSTKKVAGDNCESAEVYKDCLKAAATAHGVKDLHF